MWPFSRREPDPQPPRADDELRRSRVIDLVGEITETGGTEVVAKLLYLSHLDGRQSITLRIDSPGGSVVGGMTIVDTVCSITPPVETEAITAHGIAAMILASGHPGRRVIRSAAEVSLTPIVGHHSAAPADLERVLTRLSQDLSDFTGQPIAVVTRDLEVGRSFTPEEAVDYGLADRVAG